MKSLIRRIYAFCFVDDLILLYPLYAVMFADRGLSTLQISTLLIIWSVASTLAEIPAGVIADRYSRKNLLALGQIMRAIGYGVWLLAPNYWGFAIGFVLWGLQGALTSGTFEALVYDELKAAGEEKSYVKVIGRASSAALLGNLVATAAAAGGILLGYNFVIVVSIASVLAGAFIAFSLPESQRVQSTKEANYFKMLRDGVFQAFNTPAILKIIMLGGFLACIYGTLEEYVPLFIHDTGASKSLVSVVVALTVAAAALGSFMAYRYEKLRNATLILLLGVSGAALVVAASMTGVSAWVLMIGYTFLIKLLHTVFGGKLQYAIEKGALRATVTSVDAFVTEIMAILLYLVFGLVADVRGNVGAFKWVGLGVVVVALLYLLAAPRFARRRTFEPT